MLLEHRAHSGLGARVGGVVVPMFRTGLLVLTAALTVASQSGAQVDSELPPPPRTMGLPAGVRPYAAVGSWLIGGGVHGPLSGAAVFGIHRSITNPVLGFFGVDFEGYGGWRHDRIEVGGRILAASPFFGVHAGLDIAATPWSKAFIVGFAEPLRRGGLLLPGDNLRVDWIPARGALGISLTFPVADHHAGRTRPRSTEALIPPAPHRQLGNIPLDDPALVTLLGTIRTEARWIDRLIVPRVPAGAPELMRHEDSALALHLRSTHPSGPTGGTVTGEITAFHAELDRAFLLAIDDTTAGGAIARTVADGARQQLLDQFLLPFDRDIGQARRPGLLKSFAARAAERFGRWIATETSLSDEQTVQARVVFERLLSIMSDVAIADWTRWGDSRVGWLPLQYALRPEEYQTQSQLDRLVGRMIGQQFSGGHDLVYATDERFQSALRRSILDAEDYHVLWIHDIAGARTAGRPDSITQDMVEAYLVRLTRAARDFQRIGTVPSLMIFLDQYYYARGSSGVWLSLLADPVGKRFTTKSEYRPIQTRIQALQDSLRAAILQSPLLRAAAATSSKWIRATFRVQVNVTFPPDPSFRMRAGLGWLVPPFADDVMRDHRKIVFADVTESDPARGIAILTGLGVGESYSRYRWLDRTLILRGPAAAGMKGAARALLLDQGFAPSEIPAALWPDDPPPTYQARIDDLEKTGWTARVALATNEVGFGSKYATALKATLYSLIPAGSTIVVSDAEWSGRFWGGMLLGSALRGGRVLIIGPGPDNAPSGDAFVQLLLMREMFHRLAEARDILRDDLAASGGMLQIGLFRLGLGTYNVAGGVRAMRDGLRAYPFIREVLPFAPAVWDLFEKADSVVAAFGDSLPPDTASSYHPAFHLKVEFFGAPAAMRDVVGRPEWREFFARRIRERLGESPAGTDIAIRSLAPLQPYLTNRTAAQRDAQALFLTVGSHNEDFRSLALDGEVLCVVSGAASLLSAGDMLLLSTAGVEWLPSLAAVDRALPDIRGWRRTLSRWVEQFF